jgi:hypothetical protein
VYTPSLDLSAFNFFCSWYLIATGWYLIGDGCNKNLFFFGFGFGIFVALVSAQLVSRGCPCAARLHRTEGGMRDVAALDICATVGARAIEDLHDELLDLLDEGHFAAACCVVTSESLFLQKRTVLFQLVGTSNFLASLYL